MGTYNLSAEDIAEILCTSEECGNFEGDFTKKNFIAGAKLFIKKLRKQGAHISR